jgi:hypothetical protein
VRLGDVARQVAHMQARGLGAGAAGALLHGGVEALAMRVQRCWW